MNRPKENWIFVTAVMLIAILIARPSPLIKTTIADIIVDIAGFALIFLGLNIRISARDWKVFHGSNKLADDGPYAILRNPMYLGSLFAGTGLCLVYGSFLFTGIFIVIFIAIHSLIIKREEKFLLSEYGDTYAEYINRVPRWLPSPSGFINLLKHSFEWVKSLWKAIYRERHAIFMYIIAACVLEALADSMLFGKAKTHEGMIVWLSVAAVLFMFWMASGPILKKLGGNKF